MRKILVPLAEGFEEIEAVTVIDVLRRAGYEVVVAGLKAGNVKGSKGIQILPDRTLEEALKEDYDMVVLPGGQPGTEHLKADARVLELLRKMNERKKWIGAICAAPTVLAQAGVGEGRRVTSYPGTEDELARYRYSEERVVRDETFITSRGAGSAMEFALELVNVLSGKLKASELAGKMIAKDF